MPESPEPTYHHPMTTDRLPIAGFPHLFLAAQNDTRLRQRILHTLKAAGFSIEANRIVPPNGATGRDVIAAITAASQAAKPT